MDRRVVIALVALGVAVVLGLGALIRSDEPGPPKPPAPAPKLVAARRSERVTLPPPPSRKIPRLPAPSEQPTPAHLSPEERQTMNVAVDDVLRSARDECLKPWVASLDEPGEAEFVFDAVTYDGKVVDIGIRSLQHDIPADVLSCVDDHAWTDDWPEWKIEGELRLQRHIAISGARTAQDPPDPP